MTRAPLIAGRLTSTICGRRARTGIWWFAALFQIGAVFAADSVVKPAESTLGFSTEAKAIMRDNHLPPEKRISALEKFRASQPPSLARRSNQLEAPGQEKSLAAIRKGQFESVIAAAKSDDERELAELRRDISDAIDEMRADSVSPETRIRRFDEFRRNNVEAFDRIQALRHQINAQRAADTLRLQPAPSTGAEDPAESNITALRVRIAQRRSSYYSLSPQERIAALESDTHHPKVELESLRAIHTRKQTAPLKPQ